MNVLVAYASRHGSTAEIARAIGLELADAGLAVDVMDVREVERLADYDAVVIGSAVYVGRWLPEAERFVESYAGSLGEKLVWLFSSGPIGDPEPKPAGDPEGVAEMAQGIGARGHRVLTGKLDRDRLGIGEKVIVRVVRAPAGDFRDWPAISEYARGLAAEISATESLSRPEVRA